MMTAALQELTNDDGLPDIVAHKPRRQSVRLVARTYAGEQALDALDGLWGTMRSREDQALVPADRLPDVLDLLTTDAGVSVRTWWSW